MIRTGQSFRSANWLSAKHIWFGMLGMMTLLVIYHDERFFLDHTSNTWKFFQPVRWKLYVHAAGGAIALSLGALQFSTRLRQRQPALHRLFGRLYLGGVLLAAPMAINLAFTHALPTMATETTVQASVWGLTSVAAVLAARSRNFEVHKQWVVRSYAITLLFVFNRIILALPIVAPTTDAGAERLAWTLMVAALLGAELLINRRELAHALGISKSPE